MNALDLVRELHARGVRLWSHKGRVAFEAPAGVITEEIRVVAGTMSDELLSLVERVEESAAMLEYDEHVSRADAEARVWGEVLEGDIGGGDER